jgi:hypothetical protein
LTQPRGNQDFPEAPQRDATDYSAQEDRDVSTPRRTLEPMAGTTFTRYDTASLRADGGNEKALQGGQQTR